MKKRYQVWNLHSNLGEVVYTGDINKFYRDTREVIQRALKLDSMNDISLQIPPLPIINHPEQLSEDGYELTYYDNNGDPGVGRITWKGIDRKLASRELKRVNDVLRFVNYELSEDQLVAITAYQGISTYGSESYVVFYWTT